MHLISNVRSLEARCIKVRSSVQSKGHCKVLRDTCNSTVIRVKRRSRLLHINQSKTHHRAEYYHATPSSCHSIKISFTVLNHGNGQDFDHGLTCHCHCYLMLLQYKICIAPILMITHKRRVDLSLVFLVGKYVLSRVYTNDICTRDWREIPDTMFKRNGF